MNVPACVRGYAVRRPGSFYTFYLTLCAVSYDFGSTMVSSFVVLCARLVLLAHRMCPHASGVMLLGARGFSHDFKSTMVPGFVNLVIRLV